MAAVHARDAPSSLTLQTGWCLCGGGDAAGGGLERSGGVGWVSKRA